MRARKLVIRVLLVCFVLLAGATGALILATIHGSDDRHRLQAEVAGECFRVNYFRWYTDLTEYRSWQRDQAAATFLHEGISHGVRALGDVFAVATESDFFQPLTDCQRATRNPKLYTPPRAVPFVDVSAAYLQRFFARPPVPPRVGA